MRGSDGQFLPQHGLALDSRGKKSLLYRVWTGMRDRCNNPRHRLYAYYGGRGIAVCEEWEDYSEFHTFAMSHGYRSGLSVDRINNDLGYAPDNVRFADMKIQCRNRSNTRWLTAFGETKPAGEWVEDPRCAVGYYTLCSRLHRRWPDERAIATPSQRLRDSPEYL